MSFNDSSLNCSHSIVDYQYNAIFDIFMTCTVAKLDEPTILNVSINGSPNAVGFLVYPTFGTQISVSAQTVISPSYSLDSDVLIYFDIKDKYGNLVTEHSLPKSYSY